MREVTAAEFAERKANRDSFTKNLKGNGKFTKERLKLNKSQRMKGSQSVRPPVEKK